MQIRRPAQNVIRDWISFLVGTAGVIYETGWEQADRPTLYVLFGAMIGLPAFLTSSPVTFAPPQPQPPPTPLPPTPLPEPLPQPRPPASDQATNPPGEVR